jgi:hypothetical protein
MEEQEEEGILDPNGLFTKEEIEGIMEYRRTGKLPVWPYEDLDWNNVGGVKDPDENL